jgi:hypothetical protein
MEKVGEISIRRQQLLHVSPEITGVKSGEAEKDGDGRL